MSCHWGGGGFRGGGYNAMRFGGGGAALSRLSTKTPTNPANQEGCDRLKTELDKAVAANKESLIQCLLKAHNSLTSCKEPITTYRQATALKFVGDYCARLIVASNEGEVPPVVSKPAAAKRKKKNTTNTEDDSAPTEMKVAAKKQTTTTSSSNNDATGNSSSSSGVSAKEQYYQKAKQQAIERWSHPINSISRSSHANDLLWKVLLLVDERERESEYMLSKCIMSGIPAESRTLPIGDFTWVAQGLRKHRVNGSVETTKEVELMLGTIIERKTTEDLKCSLFGSRYNEQRLRLKNSGLPQVLFLIEGDLQRDVPGCTKESLQMAMIETRVNFGFQIVNSKHMDDTVQILKRFHRRILQRTFPQTFGLANNDALPNFNSPLATGGRRRRRSRRPESLVEMVMDTPPVPAFEDSRFITYEELKCKIFRDREAGTRTVGAIYGAMLRQITGDKKTNAIRQSYPTPAALLKAYQDVNDDPKEQEKLVANCTDLNDPAGSVKKVGPSIAKDVYIAFCASQSQALASSSTGHVLGGGGSHGAKRPSPMSSSTLSSEEEHDPKKRSKVTSSTAAKSSSTTSSAIELLSSDDEEVASKISATCQKTSNPKVAKKNNRPGSFSPKLKAKKNSETLNCNGSSSEDEDYTPSSTRPERSPPKSSGNSSVGPLTNDDVLRAKRLAALDSLSPGLTSNEKGNNKENNGGKIEQVNRKQQTKKEEPLVIELLDD